MSDRPKPEYARYMRLVGHCDQGGRPNGVQIMVHRGVIQSADVFVDASGLIYATDYNAGLFILEYSG